MARALRHYLPGVPFHLTARLQGRAPLFSGIEPIVARLLGDHAQGAGGDLLAYVVMPNHLHAVYIQGSLPLSRFMQPLLRQLALLIHSRRRSEGHVFQRRFFSVPCTDPEYLRNSILYVHLNPVRAGYCEDPAQYEWSSYPAFSSVRTWRRSGPASGLRLFAAQRCSSPAAAFENHRALLQWRIAMDALRNSRRRLPVNPPDPPATTAGDEYWVDKFGWTSTAVADHQVPRRPAADLRDLALRILRDSDPPMDLGLLRSGSRSRALVSVRRQLIALAKDQGHRNRAIARFLRISDVTVSRT